MKTFIKKLTSRKFILCIAGLIVGVALAFGADGETITALAGAVTSLVSLVTYIIAEGKIDAAALKNAAENTISAVSLLKDSTETEE